LQGWTLQGRQEFVVKISKMHIDRLRIIMAHLHRERSAH
jgi:hypothetical protein